MSIMTPILRSHIKLLEHDLLNATRQQRSLMIFGPQMWLLYTGFNVLLKKCGA